MTENSLVEAIASLAISHALRVGVAESLTSGKVAAHLGAGPDASEWFRGGVVAYAAEVKSEVLGVTSDRVVTPECARQMAHGVGRLLDADATVAVTGVGGPAPEEGEPPGTVYVAAAVRGQERCERLDLIGDPDEVLGQTTRFALQILLELMGEAVDGITARPQPDTARDAGPADSPIPGAFR